MNMAWRLFLGLGGAGIILGLIAKGVKPAIKKAVHWAISKDHPAARQFALDHREWIEAQFDAADQAVKEALDEEAAPEVLPLPGEPGH